MTDPDILQTILKDSSFDLSLFSVEEINALRQRIFIKAARGKDTAFVTCIVRGKDIQLKPEEIVRQLYAARLIGPCGYPTKRLAFEYQVTFGREKKSADIVVFDKDRPDAPYIVVELKKPKHKDGKEQLRSYCNATGAPMGVWTNGGQISHYHRKDPNYFEDITDIPGAGQTLQDILCERFTLRDLIIKDKIANERKSLKDIILDMEDEVLANAGVDVFEEVFKLIFTKLFDEYLSRKDKTKISFHLEQNLSDAERGDYEKLKHCLESLKDDKFRVMEFRNSGQTDTELKNMLKAAYVKNVDENVPRSHNLPKIAKAAGLDVTDEMQDDLIRITAFNIEARYPDYKREFRKKCTAEFTAAELKKIQEVFAWLKLTMQ